jgi:hypothetical protein
MKYAVEMASGGTMYTPSVTEISTGVQKLLGGIHIQTNSKQGHLISLLFTCQNKGIYTL